MFQADIQVLVCISHFQAINAKYTYPYCLAIKVSTLDHNGQTIQALPHSIVSSTDQDRGGSIDSKLNLYLTPYIKLEPNNYSVNIKQICSFKFNIQWKDKTNQTQLLVETFLYILNNSMSFTPVGTQVFKLKKLTGRSSYLPMFFEGFQYTCYVDASIHTQLIGLKWKKSKEGKQGDGKVRGDEGERIKYNTFAEYIAGETSMSASLLTDISQKYTKLLLGSIQKLQHSISKLQEQSIKFQTPELFPLNTNDPNKWGCLFQSNLNELSGYCFQLWNQYIRIRATFPDILQLKQSFQDQLKYEYKRHIYDKLCQQTKSEKMLERKINNEIIVVGDLKLPRSVKVFVERGDLFPIEDQKSDYCLDMEKEHIVVLVHGLSANRMAMEALKNILLYYFPHLKVVTSIANQNRTEEHIQQMGKRLSEEVRFIISSRKLTNYRISFICHSLGGLITRAALLHLQSFKDHFETLITLGTPHLGYLFHHSSLVNIGIWFLNRWKQSLSLSMLSFTDKQNLNESYLYRLSMQPGFEWFQHVVLISNPKDSYVSEHSALIENCQDAVNDKKSRGEKGNIYHQIMDNLTERLDKTKTTRITVHGLLSTKTGMDSIIGRTAHIEYLSDNTFLKMFVLSHQNLFKY